MTTKHLSRILLFFLCTIGFAGCGDDKDNDDITNDPVSTVTLNMLDEQNGKTMLGNSDVYINKANNFKTHSCLISDAGNAAGVGIKIDPRLNNLSREIAVIPGHIYQIFDEASLRDFPSGNRAVQLETGFYQAYVVSPIVNKDTTTGAVIKYILTYPDKKGLPEFGHILGSLNSSGETIETTLPQDAECFFENHFGSEETGAFHISLTDGKLTVTLNKNPDIISGPYGTYRTYIRTANVFTVVIINVGL